MSMAACTWPRVSDSGLPISRVISRAKSSLRFTRVSAARYRISARLGAGTKRHVWNASLAASTAASTSSAVERGNIPTNSRVFAGLRSSNAMPLEASTHSPLMKFLKTVGRTAVAIVSSEHLQDTAFLGSLLLPRGSVGGRRLWRGQWRGTPGDFRAQAKLLQGRRVEFARSGKPMRRLEVLHRLNGR